MPRRINDRKQLNLCHLHPLAGMDADCTRCGKEWRDFESVYFPATTAVHEEKVTK